MVCDAKEKSGEFSEFSASFVLPLDIY